MPEQQNHGDPTFLILYGDDWFNKKSSANTDIKINFKYFLKLGKSKSINIGLTSLNLYEEKSKTFEAIFISKDRWISKKNVSPNALYDKTVLNLNSEKLSFLRRKVHKSFFVVNSLEFKNLATNKWKSYLLLKGFSPKTVLIKNKKQSPLIKSYFEPDKIIIKPLEGMCGKGVRVIEKNKFTPTSFPFIAQELIDSRSGITNITKGAHDLRLMFLNNKIFHSYVRIPPPGKFISNLSHGGKVKVVPLHKIPKSIITIAKKVSRKLRGFAPIIYSIDFIIDERKVPRIIEINSSPAFTLEKQEMSYRKKFFLPLVKFFKELMIKKNTYP